LQFCTKFFSLFLTNFKNFHPFFPPTAPFDFVFIEIYDSNCHSFSLFLLASMAFRWKKGEIIMSDSDIFLLPFCRRSVLDIRCRLHASFLLILPLQFNWMNLNSLGRAKQSNGFDICILFMFRWKCTSGK
jgi:hypothetical protein